VSLVTDIILITAVGDSVSDGESETEAMLEVQSWLGRGNYGQLVAVDKWAGGNKAMQAEVWMGAFNYFKLEEFVAFVKSQKWESPDRVQVLTQREEDAVFAIQ
jgi:hypothetical protein